MGRSVECSVDSSSLVVRSADGVERVLRYGMVRWFCTAL